MKKCVHCGEMIDDKDTYCLYCGKQQPSSNANAPKATKKRRAVKKPAQLPVQPSVNLTCPGAEVCLVKATKRRAKTRPPERGDAKQKTTVGGKNSGKSAADTAGDETSRRWAVQ